MSDSNLRACSRPCVRRIYQTTCNPLTQHVIRNVYRVHNWNGAWTHTSTKRTACKHYGWKTYRHISMTNTSTRWAIGGHFHRLPTTRGGHSVDNVPLYSVAQCSVIYTYMYTCTTYHGTAMRRVVHTVPHKPTSRNLSERWQDACDTRNSLMYTPSEQ